MPGDRGIQQLGDGALVHVGVLPHVEPGEMEAEAVDGAAQQPQPAAGDDAGTVGDQRAVEHVEIGPELGDAGIGRRLADGLARDLDLQHFGAVAASRA